MSTEKPVELTEIRAAHVLCTHSSIRTGGIKLNKAGCSCGAYYAWNRREAEHDEHVDAVIVEHFAAREAAARREALLEAAAVLTETDTLLDPANLRAPVAEWLRLRALAEPERDEESGR